MRAELLAEMEWVPDHPRTRATSSARYAPTIVSALLRRFDQAQVRMGLVGQHLGRAPGSRDQLSSMVWYITSPSSSVVGGDDLGGKGLGPYLSKLLCQGCWDKNSVAGLLQHGPKSVRCGPHGGQDPERSERRTGQPRPPPGPRAGGPRVVAMHAFLRAAGIFHHVSRAWWRGRRRASAGVPARNARISCPCRWPQPRRDGRGPSSRDLQSPACRGRSGSAPP